MEESTIAISTPFMYTEFLVDNGQNFQTSIDFLSSVLGRGFLSWKSDRCNSQYSSEEYVKQSPCFTQHITHDGTEIRVLCFHGDRDFAILYRIFVE